MSESNSDRDKQDPHGLDASDRVLIVEPNARLVIEIYQPLMAFVQEIETALECSSEGYVFFSFISNHAWLVLLPNTLLIV